MKLNSLSVFIFFVLLVFSGFSKQIDSDYAGTTAVKFLQQNQSNLKRSVTSLNLHYTETFKDQSGNNKRSISKNSFYIFNFSDGKGFVIVSADDRVKPILGYSLEKSFEIEKAPTHVQNWLKEYEEEIIKIINDDSKPIHPEWSNINLRTSNIKRGVNTQVLPLLKSTWSQSPIYNDSCPKDPSTNTLSVTGCVATAMAQTMNYWNYPQTGKGSNQYTLSTIGTLKADFSKSVYKWADMSTNISSTSTVSAKTAVAKLMKDCGYAVNMQYSSKGSGAWVFGRQYPTAELALINNFGYSDAMSSIYKKNFTDADWINKLKSEFDQSRVVIYVGYSSDTLSGHCFVADGYDVNNYIHFNWGWGGYYNGYFSVANLNPVTGYNYTTEQGALIGIRPPVCIDGITGNSQVCVGVNTSYQTLYPGGTWTSSNNSIASITSSGVLTPINSGVVTVTYTLPAGSNCSSSFYTKDITVVGYPQKPTTILGDTAFCQFDSGKYSVDVSTIGNWYSYNTNIKVSTDGTVYGSASGKALLKFGFGNVCFKDSVSKWINIKSTPVVPKINGLDSICVNVTSQYTNTLTGGVWSVSDNLSSVSTSGLLKGLNQGVTTLVYAKSNTNGCVGKAIKLIKVKAIPMPILQGPDSLCLNSSFTYLSSIPKGTWSATNSMISYTSTGLVTAKMVGTTGLKYTVNVSGCSNTVTKQIIVKALPLVGTLSGTTSFCGTTTTTFTSTVKGGTWSISNMPIFAINQSGVISSNNSINSTALATYSLTQNNCTNKVTRSVSVTALPTISITGIDSLSLNQQYVYKASSTGGVWSVLDNHLKVTSTGTVTGLSTSSGSGLKYQLNGSGSCSGKSSVAIKTIKVYTPSTLVVARKGDISIYPNPTSGLIHITTESNLSNIKLLDLTGKILEENDIYEGQLSLDYTHVVPGKYILYILHQNNDISNLPILIER